MNAAIRAVVRTGVAHKWEMYGIKLGYEGLINGKIIPLGTRDVGGIIQRGGTILGSARSLEFKTEDGQRRAMRSLNEIGIDALVVIGGNGSQTGANSLFKLGFPTVGIASTIDNDLWGPDITIGVDTALNIALESIDRLKTTASSHQRAFLIEVMGRGCGYLALMGGMATGAERVYLHEEGVKLRDLQVDVRVIAASNRDLEKAVREGQFRQDLYYRLAIIAIFIPALRERKEDILPLVDFFIERYNRRFRKSVRGIADETRRLLLQHNWPGNVRELKNSIERAMILEDEPLLRSVYLPFSVSEAAAGMTMFERTAAQESGQVLPNGRSLPKLHIPEGGTSLEEVERAMVELAMKQAGNNQTHAARLLDISRDALRYKLKKFGLMPGDEAALEETSQGAEP